MMVRAALPVFLFVFCATTMGTGGRLSAQPGEDPEGPARTLDCAKPENKICVECGGDEIACCFEPADCDIINPPLEDPGPEDPSPPDDSTRIDCSEEKNRVCLECGGDQIFCCFDEDCEVVGRGVSEPPLDGRSPTPPAALVRLDGVEGGSKVAGYEGWIGVDRFGQPRNRSSLDSIGPSRLSVWIQRSIGSGEDEVSHHLHQLLATGAIETLELHLVQLGEEGAPVTQGRYVWKGCRVSRLGIGEDDAEITQFDCQDLETDSN